VADGGHPVVEIMIPLTVTREELALARGWVEEAVASVAAEGATSRTGKRTKGGDSGAKDAGSIDVTIGTMIETPRAALRAGEIAEEADFFSFGTNDLTQMTFGFSRDDVEGRMMAAYLELGLLKRNPFEVVDPDGVGELVRLGVARGRATRPGLKIGVCGEHGGDPESIGTFYQAGLDYVSCSPFRVPVARLASAQAVLAAGDGATAGAKRAPAKKAAAQKAAAQNAQKVAAKKSVANKAVANKAVAKKTVANKAVAKKTVAKKAVANKTVAKKAVAKRAVAKKAPAKKAARR
jgi:phosphoenolpyruvate-protein kinase (PTS system EI component)